MEMNFFFFKEKMYIDTRGGISETERKNCLTL